MATPALRALGRDLPALTEFCWVGRPGPLMVLDGFPWATSTLTYKPRSKQPGILNRRQLVAQLRRRRFDAIVLLTNSFSTAMIAYLAGIPQRTGFARDCRSWLLSDPVPVATQTQDARRDPCIDSYLRLAEHLGCRTEDRSTHLATTAADRQLAQSRLQELAWDPYRPLVVLNAGAATAETKRWPTHHAAEAARALAQTHGCNVLVHCGPAERQAANAIESQADHPAVRSMGRWNDLPLGLSKALIEQAQLVVSTDSGPRHIAVAMNKPVVSLFGSIDPNLTRSYNLPESIVTLGLPCQPCGKYQCPLKHAQCMNALGPERILHAASRTLSALHRAAS